MSRVKNSFINFLASIGGQILSIILGFVTRTIFINTLGIKYLGINGLFTNIISMLSLVELGVGSAIIFDLYKPIAKNDTNRIILLMKFYKSAYRIIGLVIGVIGILIMPFLPYIIKDDISFVNVNLVFFIFLLQSVASYLFFMYKSAIIITHQKEYIVTLITSIFSIISSVVKITVLIVFNDFILYLISFIIVDILANLYIAHKADLMYPYINKKTNDVIPKAEKREIFKNCYAIFIYKVNNVIQDATDNILLSTFIGLNIVGIYSNYLLIITAIRRFLSKIYNAIKASVGDLHAHEDIDHELFVFKAVNFFTMCSFGLAAVGIFVVVNEFIYVWVGNEFVLSQSFAFLIALELYIFGLQKFLSTFRISMGLFQQAKYRPLFNSVINLIVSIILVQYIGIYGVLIGTIISSLLTYMWFDPLVIYKYAFKRSVKEYYITNIKYLLLISLSGTVSYFLSRLIIFEGVFFIIVSAIISIITTLFFILVFYRKSKEFKYIYSISISILLKLKDRILQPKISIVK